MQNPDSEAIRGMYSGPYWLAGSSKICLNAQQNTSTEGDRSQVMKSWDVLLGSALKKKKKKELSQN